MTKTFAALAASLLVAATAGQALALNPQPLPPHCAPDVPCGPHAPKPPHPLAHFRHHRHHHHHSHGHGPRKAGGEQE
jgi:hypothetical protein